MGGAGVIATWDMGVLDFIQNHLTSTLGDLVFPFLTHLGDLGAVWIAFDIFLFIYPKTRRLGITVALAIALEVLCCDVLLKPLVARMRPFEVNTAAQLLIDPPSGFSFPSGHTSMGFAVTTAVFCSKSKMWIPSLILTVLIAFSRLYLYVHYPTDVLAGIGLGILSGWAAERIVHEVSKNTRNPEPA